MEVYLDRLLRATTKKGRQKCTPEILATPMTVTSTHNYDAMNDEKPSDTAGKKAVTKSTEI